MPLKLIKNDITKMECDAIVNAANSSLLGGGGVDGAIHQAAGPKLLKECKTLNGCETGFAKITKGYNLPAKYVIHTVGPIWDGGFYGEENDLRNCYKNSLNLALEYKCKSIAFPIISSGVYGYPKQEALKIAIDEITNFISKNEMLVYIVIYSNLTSYIAKKLYNDIKSYVDYNYEIENHVCESSSISLGKMEFNDKICENVDIKEVSGILSNLDESFSQMVLRKIDESGLTDIECYKKANIDRKLFSKLRSNIHYSPSKRTAISLGIALELNEEDMDSLLNKAGYSLSSSSKFDLIIKYFIEHKNYDIYEINEFLFAFDQQLLN